MLEFSSLPVRKGHNSTVLSFFLKPRRHSPRGCYALKLPRQISREFSCAAVADGGLSKSRRELLLEYVKNVQPEFMDKFVKRAPQQVVDAMRQTVTNMVGTLPSQFFEVTVTTVGESLAQLMYSLMMTGYMFHNAHYRMELEKSLESFSSLHSPQNPTSAPRSRTSSVQGHVLLPLASPDGDNRGRAEGGGGGPEAMDAAQYIEVLEGELEDLRRQLALERSQFGGEGQSVGEPLLEYLKRLKPQNLQELTASAGDDALEAMNTFIQRLMGVADTAELRSSMTETSAAELAKLLYWLMVVGYGIRNIEVRHDMERILGTSPKPFELPSGGDM